jgi:hypothetical protein
MASELYYSITVQPERHPPEVAIIGSGYGFKEILPVLAGFRDIKINLMKPRNLPDSQSKNISDLNVNFMNLNEIIDQPSIKVVFLALPPFLQRQYIEKLAPTGKSIYLEKPAGLNSAEALEIQELCERFRSKLYLGFQFRFDPGIQLLNASQKLSVLGERSVSVDWNIKQGEIKDNWKRDINKGGGVYRDHLCHVVDVLRNTLKFSDDFFDSNLKLVSKSTEIIDKVILESDNLHIRICRSKNLQSSMKFSLQSKLENTQLEMKFPFRLSDYSLSLGSNSKKLPSSLGLHQDARRYSLNTYINQILESEFTAPNSNIDTVFPNISDAIFTQKLADRIKETETS